jgi:hypothetical protein
MAGMYLTRAVPDFTKIWVCLPPNSLKKRMDEKPFRPFRIKMSSGDTFDVRNHDSAWVLRNVIEIAIDPDAEGFASQSRHAPFSTSPASKTSQRQRLLSTKTDIRSHATRFPQ